MKIYKSFIFFILLTSKVYLAFPSTLTYLITFDDYVNAIYERQNFTEEDFESTKEALREAYATPLDLNKATFASLGALGILSTGQIKNFFNHLAATGPLYSKYELQAIPDFDLRTITLLLPFVYIVESYYPRSDYPKIGQNGPNYFIFRYAPALNQKLNQQRSALGGLDKYMVQLSCNHSNNITWGITGRKQAGEAFCWDHTTYRYGFSLWSIFLILNHKKRIKQIIIGDYEIGYGQGLLLSAGYIQTGTPITSIIRSNNLGVRSYKGIRRTGLHGIAITSDLGLIELTGFYSNNNLDAILGLDAENKLYAKGIDYTGKYNTIHQLAKKGTLHKQTLGCTIRKQYDRSQTEVGINLLYNYYDIPIRWEVGSTESYLFQKQSAASLFYRLLWKNWLFFGEGGITVPYAIAAKKSKALITRSIVSFSRYLDFSVALYYYDKGSYTPYGHPFKRYATDHSNEQGMYTAFTITPLSTWQIAISSHFFATSPLKPPLVIASSGYRLVTRSSYTLNRKTIWVIQYKLCKSPKNKAKEDRQSALSPVAIAIQNSFKSKVDHHFTHYWRIQSEVQYTHYTFLAETYHGYALSSTQKWKVNTYQFVSKAIYFNSNNYATRLYFYLPNPLYSGTQFRPYYGHGFATIWLLSWRPIQSVRLDISYSFIYSFDNEDKKYSSKSNRSSKSKHNGMIQLLVNF